MRVRCSCEYFFSYKNVSAFIYLQAMNIIEEHRTQVRIDANTFSVKVFVTADETRGDARRRISVDIGAFGPDGEAVAGGNFEVDAELVATLTAVLSDTLRQRSLSVSRTGQNSKASAPRGGHPWTDEHDVALERKWIEGEGVANLAAYFERTPGAIRARLPRVGCDPENPGEYLPQPPSQRRPDQEDVSLAR